MLSIGQATSRFHLSLSEALLGSALGPEHKADGGALLQGMAAAQHAHLLTAVQDLHAPLPGSNSPLQKRSHPPALARSVSHIDPGIMRASA